MGAEDSVRGYVSVLAHLAVRDALGVLVVAIPLAQRVVQMAVLHPAVVVQMAVFLDAHIPVVPDVQPAR